jgi:hypothetical protein
MAGPAVREPEAAPGLRSGAVFQPATQGLATVTATSPDVRQPEVRGPERHVPGLRMPEVPGMDVRDGRARLPETEEAASLLAIAGLRRSRREAADASAPIVRVEIGRVEVRAPPPPPAREPADIPRPAAFVSLQKYLHKRGAS